MTLTATKFTPEVLLSAPRRSAGRPNRTGTKVLFTVSTYSFEQHERTSQVRVLDIGTGQSTLLYEGPKYSEPTWLTEDEFVLLEAAEKGDGGGGTSLLLVRASQPGSRPAVIARFPGAVSNLKVRALLPDDDGGEGGFALACSAPATRDGDMARPGGDKKRGSTPHSSARVHDSLFVRHWDSWVGDTADAIWYGCLRRRRGEGEDGAGYALLPQTGLVNALAGTGLSSPVPPFGGTGDFDVGPRGIVFVAKDPRLCPASHTKTDLYFLPVASFADSGKAAGAASPRAVGTGDLRGYCASPAFSRRGDRVAFTRMRGDQYESDKPRLLVVDDIGGEGEEGEAREFYETEDGKGGWDARPEEVVWGAGDAELFVTAEEHGRSKVWKLDAEPRAGSEGLPVALTSEGSVSSFGLLAEGSDKLFITSSSLVDNSCYGILDPASGVLETVSSSSRHGKTFGLSKTTQFDDFWFRGAGDYDVHALVLKPSDFDKSKKYPLALLIHGGPQGAWGDSWSTRWNPAVFAEQGYVVVSPNPTGSTGYGMALQDGIKGQWGGRPYEDLVNCFDHIADNMPYVDTSNAVALGASYGGYMINWIQGHPLGRKFKALVCHDGVFTTMNMWCTEELFFPIHDFEGTIWENREGYEKWDPARFAGEWATPELIIHSDLDYRLPVTEGLAAFNVLQSRSVPSRLLTFPDENHWVLHPENSLVWHREVLAWINKYTGIDKSDAEDKTPGRALEIRN